MENIQYKAFIFEFDKFLNTTVVKGGIVTTRQIKRWVRALDETHPLKLSFLQWVSTTTNSIDFNRIVHHMKALPGFYQTFAYQRRVGIGINSKRVIVKQNKIKL